MRGPFNLVLLLSSLSGIFLTFSEGSHILLAVSVTEKASAITVFLHTVLSIPLISLGALFFTFSV